MILAIDQGTTGTTCLVVDDELRPVGRGYREFAQHFPRAGLGRARPGRDLGERRASPRGRRSPRRESGAADVSARSGSPTSARRSSSGSGAPAPGAPGDRLAGPAHRRALRRAPAPTWCASAPASSPTRTSRRRSSSGSCARTELPQERARLRHDRLLARLEADRRRRHVTDVTNASRTMLLDLDDGRLGRRAARRCSASIAPCCPRSSLLGGVVAEATLLGATRPGRRASPATSRRRSSARAASPPARRRRPTGPGTFVLVNLGGEAGEVGEGLLRTVACRRTRHAPGSSRPRERCSSPAPRCSGCATASA